MEFYYVYILQSTRIPDRFYVGSTDDLKERLGRHNSGSVPSTAPARPWKIKTAVAFTDAERAAKFERCLKTGSGRAFAKKHL